MPTVSFDGQSLIIDNRRVWLVSGSIHYPRVPRDLWQSRIRAAKQAGLNCICTYVFWNFHENSPGDFDFSGQKDLRKFVTLVGQEGMYCILRPGPYVCSEWDFGGFPAWLLRGDEMKLRQYHEPYLEACSRYLGAVLDQVRDLQVTSPAKAGLPGSPAGGGGPIVMMQAENEWFCHNPDEACKHPSTYLREIVRYLRESGCSVPINVCNNLWQRVEGAIDTWNANSHLAADLRQLRIVQPSVPRIVTEFWPGWFDYWGGEHDRRSSAQLVEYRLASILAVGGHYNLYMFHGGTNFGFYGGRSVANSQCFMTTSYDYDAPLREAGGRGPKYHAVKRVSTFASQFAHVLANLDPESQPAVVAPSEDSHPLSVLHQRGAQGDVVFLLKSQDSRLRTAQILLPNGLTLPVPLGHGLTAWLLLNARLAGNVELTYTNLRPWAWINRKLLVLFGPAGSDGLVAIDGATLRLRVPTGLEPLVHKLENLHVVVLSEQQVDAAYPLADRLIVGASALNEHDQPIPHPDWKHVFIISDTGEIRQFAVKPSRRRTAPRFSAWECAGLDDMLDGSSPTYRPIDGPTSLEQLGCNFGYGWYRLTLERTSPAGNLLAPQSADRLHVYSEGKLLGILGRGPGAVDEPTPLRMPKGPAVVLADNLGRFCYGWRLGESKGLFGHLHSVKPLRLGKPKVVAGQSPDPFLLGDYWTHMRAGEKRPADALVWNDLRPQGRNPLILELADFPQTCMVFINGKPLALFDKHLSGGIQRWVLDVGQTIKSGRNELTLALFAPCQKTNNLDAFVKVYQSTANLTDAASWAFAPWRSEPTQPWQPIPKTQPARPCWFRSHFSVLETTVPLWLEPRGMSKGQIYLNGQNVGRYFVSTSSGKKVPPQERYYLPEPWLRTNAPNELRLFDEHGRSPRDCRLLYDALGPYG